MQEFDPVNEHLNWKSNNEKLTENYAFDTSFSISQNSSQPLELILSNEQLIINWVRKS